MDATEQAKPSLRELARKMGMSVSDAAEAEPWPADSVAAYAAKHGNRADPLGHRHLPDVQIASAVRMLMREDLDHEAVVCAARDRICALHLEKQDLLAALKRTRECLRGLQPALNVMAREVLDDIIADQIDAAIAKAEA